MSLLVKLTGVPAWLTRPIEVSELYFQHGLGAPATQADVPYGGTVSGASLRCTRCVSFGVARSAVFAALYASVVELLPLMMYS